MNKFANYSLMRIKNDYLAHLQLIYLLLTCYLEFN